MSPSQVNRTDATIPRPDARGGALDCQHSIDNSIMHHVGHAIDEPKDSMTDHYTYRVTWSPEGGEYAGHCVEFPSLSWLAPTAEEAFFGIRALVHDVLASMRANAETPPAPLADRAYSGKFLVRVPPETHRALVLRAAEEGVSLNRLVSARLAD